MPVVGRCREQLGRPEIAGEEMLAVAEAMEELADGLDSRSRRDPGRRCAR
jgi:hypothetical protein